MASLIIPTILGLSVFGLIIAGIYTKIVINVSVDNEIKEDSVRERIKFIHRAISDGAMAYLNSQSRYLLVFMIGFAIIIGLLIDDSQTKDINEGIYTAISFIFGCIISILSGYIGMKIATEGNVRTTVLAKSSIKRAFDMALYSGSVMGFALVGLAVLGLILIFLALTSLLPAGVEPQILLECMAGFGLGGSSIALFGRVGGGIFTKAADVGADLVGKVEKGIPEDDPRNPAVIADNVGDNVGDVAGMGSDLFGSCAESTCAALVIGAVAFSGNLGALLYPILVSAVGIPIALISMFSAKINTEKDVQGALKKLLFVSTGLMCLVMYFVTVEFLPNIFVIKGSSYSNIGVYWCLLSGLISGLIIGVITEYYTSYEFSPVREVADSAKTGAATNIIFGLALGYYSVLGPILAIVITIFISFTFAGMYGVAIAALGMLGTLAIGLTIDAYGPVSDNAGGIAEMTGLEKIVRDRTDVLDAAGNTTAAIGKGFAIGSAILTSLALFSAFLTRANHLTESKEGSSKLLNINILEPLVLSGLFVGAMLPFLFSAMTMKSVGKAAFAMIEEVRSQFRSIPGLMEGKADPDYNKCVEISTQASLKYMTPPAILILGAPLITGFLFGIPALAGLLVGSLVSGGVLAIASVNAGGAWDNAKKYIEAGNLGGKGTETHKAAVVGDTVGDPFKDTSGPSLNILLKLSAILSLVFVPFFVESGGLLLRFLN